MLPKIKKKISSFLMDEKGTISKKNLIKGAIILSSIGLAAKDVKPYSIGPGGIVGEITADPVPGTTMTYGPVTNWNCNPVDSNNVTTTTCTPGAQTCGGSHSNSGTVVHKSVNRSWHKNDLDFTHPTDTSSLEGKHVHHGKHYNANTIGCTGNTHTNHCSY